MRPPRVFVDEMVSGAFASFRHEHAFDERGDGTTLMHDRFDYRSPLGWLGSIADALFLESYMRAFLLQRAAFLKGAAERP